MVPRSALPWLLLLTAGCHALAPAAGKPPAADAERLWADGQAAMKNGQPEEAIGCYEQSLAADAARVHNHLSLAAALLEKGDAAGACDHLRQYMAACPDDWKARGYYAELLWREHRLPEARAEFERCVADLPDFGPAATKQRVHCHGRLTKIAAAEQDRYAEHLHRGIGLYHLGQSRAALPDPDGMLPAEGLWFRSARELTLARMYRPDDARPSWYLYEVWTCLGQRQPARCSLAAASDQALFTDLTPTERRDLWLACQAEDRPRK